MNLPQNLLHNPHFVRYYRTWQRNGDSLVFIPLAQIFREQGMLSEAKEVCLRGLGRHPESVSGRLMMAQIYFDLEDLKESKRLLEELLNEFPAQREAGVLLGRIRKCLGLPEVTAKSATVPNVPAASLWENVTMVKIYADQGEIKVAREILERILVRDPKNTQALQLREKLS